jgi:ABC-type phosphate/phosphonate transport system substrate-binding protein
VVAHVIFKEKRAIDGIRHPHARLLAALTLCTLAVTACGGRAAVSQPTPTPPPTWTPAPTPIPPRPTDPPPGSSQNPLTMMFVLPGDNQAAADSAQTLAERLADATDLQVEAETTDSYADVLAALCEGAAFVGSLDAFAALSASQQGCAEPLYLAVRDGETATGGWLIANAEAKVNNVEGFAGQVFCRPDAALPGWIVASLTLRAHGIDPTIQLEAVRDAGSDEDVLRMVHDGECQVGVTGLGQEAAGRLDEPERVVFVEALAPVPNEAIVISNRLGPDTRRAVDGVLDGQRDLLGEIIGADGLERASEDDFADLHALFDEAGVDVVALGQ